MTDRRAFTMIELLIVITVIALLAAMLLPAVNLVRNKAISTQTISRIEAVFDGLVRLAGERSPAVAVQTDADLDGVKVWATPAPLANGLVPFNDIGVGARWTEPETNANVLAAAGVIASPFRNGPLTYGASDGHQMRHPWGRPVENAAVGKAGIFDQSAETRDMTTLSARRTVALLVAAGILPPTGAEASYTGNRSPKSAWNDAWGNPLVVVHAVYQPEWNPNTASYNWNSATGFPNRKDGLPQSTGAATVQQLLKTCRRLDDHRRQYGFNRAVYVAVGAAGQKVRETLDWSGTATPWSGEPVANRCDRLWQQIRETCAAADWTQDAWAAAPWSGVRKRSAGGETCFLSAPQEYR